MSRSAPTSSALTWSEVSPPFDVGGCTALVAATIMFELLCVLADALARRRAAKP